MKMDDAVLDEDEYARRRITKGEAYDIRQTGTGTTPRSLTVVRQYLPQLKELVAADLRRSRSDSKVWPKLRRIENLELRLLIAGINVALDADAGTNNNGDKTAVAVRRWLGQQLDQHDNEMEWRVGDWAVDRLVELEIFALDGRDVLVPAVELHLRLDDLFESAVAQRMILPPTEAEAPPPWTDVWRHYRGVRVPLVKDHKSRAAMRAAIRRGEMPVVLDALNALERVPCIINGPILDVALKKPPVVPPMPDLLDAWLAEHKKDRAPQWLIESNEEVSDWYAEQAKADAWHIAMQRAKAVAARGRFVIPLYLDHRGRNCGRPLFNFHGPDYVRGLFYLANGKAIGTEGLLQLRACVAGLADGHDWDGDPKPSRLNFDGRLAWVERNMHRFRAIGDAVARGEYPELPANLKDPVQFIAAVYELVRADRVGPDFITHLPLSFDATCSGLQHLCTMMRSKDARYANISASQVREDFYERVADRANEILVDRWVVEFNGEDEPDKKRKPKRDKKRKPKRRRYPKPDDEVIDLARWLRHNVDGLVPLQQVAAELASYGCCYPNGKPYSARSVAAMLGEYRPRWKTFSTKAEADRFAETVDLFGAGYIDVVITRDFTKRPSVSFIYGATLQTITPHVVDVLKEQKKSKIGAAAIASAINKAIGEVAPAAKRVRRFLKSLAKICAKHNVLLRWPTPLGLPVLNLADEPDIKTVSIQKDGKRRRRKVTVGDTGNIDRKAAVRSAPANFVHSLDASHLMLVACQCQANLKNIQMVAVHELVRLFGV